MRGILEVCVLNFSTVLQEFRKDAIINLKSQKSRALLIRIKARTGTGVRRLTQREQNAHVCVTRQILISSVLTLTL